MANITADRLNTRVDPGVASPIRPLTARDQLQGIIDVEPRGSGRMPPTIVPTRRPGIGARAARPTARMPNPARDRRNAQDDEIRMMHRRAQAQRQIQAQEDQAEGTLRGSLTKPIAGFNYMGMVEATERLPSRLRPQQGSLIPSGNVENAGDSSRRTQLADQAVERGRLDQQRQRNLLSALQDQTDYMGF